MDQRAASDQIVKPEILNRIALRHRLLSRMTLGFVAGALTVTPFPAGIKYLLTVVVVVPIVVLTYHYGVRSTRFGRLLTSGKRGGAS